MASPRAASYIRGMAVATRSPRVGELLRSWRQRRNISQLELSSGSAVSSRHLSFIETGRSKPSREMLVYLSEQLEIPLREAGPGIKVMRFVRISIEVNRLFELLHRLAVSMHE